MKALVYEGRDAISVFNESFIAKGGSMQLSYLHGR